LLDLGSFQGYGGEPNSSSSASAELALYQAATAALTAKTQHGPEGRNQQMIKNAWPR